MKGKGWGKDKCMSGAARLLIHPTNPPFPLPVHPILSMQSVNLPSQLQLQRHPSCFSARDRSVCQSVSCDLTLLHFTCNYVETVNSRNSMRLQSHPFLSILSHFLSHRRTHSHQTLFIIAPWSPCKINSIKSNVSVPLSEKREREREK